jgi:hypothetical protein
MSCRALGIPRLAGYRKLLGRATPVPGPALGLAAPHCRFGAEQGIAGLGPG